MNQMRLQLSKRLWEESLIHFKKHNLPLPNFLKGREEEEQEKSFHTDS